MNGLLDGSKTFETAAAGRIDINKDFFLIGTQNSGSKYTATNRLDAATRSRVGIVNFPYNDSIFDILKEAVNERTKKVLTDAYFKACDKFYCGVRKLFESGSVSDAAMNVRGFVQALNETASINVGNKSFIPMVKLTEAIKTCVINTCEEDKDNALLLGLIDACINNL